MNQSVFEDIATEMLETSTIIYAIKAIGTIKKRPDELSIYHYVKRVNPSIDINVIINSLKTWMKCKKLKTNHAVLKVPVTSFDLKTLLVTEWTSLIPRNISSTVYGRRYLKSNSLIHCQSDQINFFCLKWHISSTWTTAHTVISNIKNQRCSTTGHKNRNM